jgi:sn-glycerol 3-phosphate transport system permease protein
VTRLGLLDTKLAIMAPYLASAYGTFLLRQTFKGIPKELEEAAALDGCGTFRFLLHVAIPLALPGYLAFGLVSITYHWNDFFWPLVVTETTRSRTLTLGLGIFAQTAEGSADWTMLMAMTLMVIAVPLAVFLVFQRRFINSFMQSGLGG